MKPNIEERFLVIWIDIILYWWILYKILKSCLHVKYVNLPNYSLISTSRQILQVHFSIVMCLASCFSFTDMFVPLPLLYKNLTEIIVSKPFKRMCYAQHLNQHTYLLLVRRFFPPSDMNMHVSPCSQLKLTIFCFRFSVKCEGSLLRSLNIISHYS